MEKKKEKNREERIEVRMEATKDTVKINVRYISINILREKYANGEQKLGGKFHFYRYRCSHHEQK